MKCYNSFFMLQGKYFSGLIYASELGVAFVCEADLAKQNVSVKT